MAIKISILIPTCNRPQLLARCLQKLTTSLQNCKEGFEIIVSDDSKNNESEILCLNFQKTWNGSFHYFHNIPGLGQQKNFNVSIERAVGEYIQFVHDDDYLLPDGGRYLLDAAIKYSGNATPLKFGVTLVSLKEKPYRQEVAKRESLLYPSEALCHFVTNSSYVRFPAMLIPRKTYIEAGLFDSTYSYSADLALWLKMVEKHGLIEIPKLTAAYTIHAEAGTSIMFSEKYILKAMDLLSIYAPLTGCSAETQKKMMGEFLFRYVIAGVLRSYKLRSYEDMQIRLSLLDILHKNHFPCPLKWVLLPPALHFVAFLHRMLRFL